LSSLFYINFNASGIITRACMTFAAHLKSTSLGKPICFSHISPHRSLPTSSKFIINFPLTDYSDYAFCDYNRQN